MKKKLYLLTTVLTTSAVLFLSSCLKDKAHYVNFDTGQTLVDFPLGGFLNFSNEAVTASADTTPGDVGNTKTKIGLNVASANVPTTATVIQLKIGDPADVTTINTLQTAVIYTLMPAADYVAIPTTVTIPSGQQYTTFTVTVHKNLLDPSLSYVLPIKIISGTGATVASNLAVYYMHFIGNDFAGAYTYDFRRYQNGVGPGNGADGKPAVPSNPADAGSPPDITDLGETETIFPVTPNEFQMQTEYNGQGVNYDVTFTKTVTAGISYYTNWAVTFLPADLAKWTAAGITNFQPPAFTIPPPATSSDKKVFELNYISGGAHPRYIDDTYTKQ